MPAGCVPVLVAVRSIARGAHGISTSSARARLSCSHGIALTKASPILFQLVAGEDLHHIAGGRKAAGRHAKGQEHERKGTKRSGRIPEPSAQEQDTRPRSSGERRETAGDRHWSDNFSVLLRRDGTPSSSTSMPSRPSCRSPRSSCSTGTRPRLQADLSEVAGEQTSQAQVFETARPATRGRRVVPP